MESGNYSVEELSKNDCVIIVNSSVGVERNSPESYEGRQEWVPSTYNNLRRSESP